MYESYPDNVLVVIDAYRDLPESYSHLEESWNRLCFKICKKIVQWKGPIVLANYGSPVPHHRVVQTVQRKDIRLISNDYDEVIEWLKRKELKNLFFAGQSVPGCVVQRDLGYEKMESLGFDCHLCPEYIGSYTGLEFHAEDTRDYMYNHIIKNKFKVVWI